MGKYPPKWADRFLKWYCDPEFLEEIQGDAHELYFERLEKEGKTRADLKYIFDVIRFFRWSNIHKDSDGNKPSYLDVLWVLAILKFKTHNTSRKLGLLPSLSI